MHCWGLDGQTWEHLVNNRRATHIVFFAVVAMGILTALGAIVMPMSSLERLAQFATAVGPIVIVGSAYFVIRQVQEAQATLRGQLFDATAGRMLDLSRLFVEHPDLRPYFYDGRDVPDETDSLRQRVLAAAELHVDYLDTELLRRKLFAPSLKELPGFEPWIRGLLRTSPAMCRILHNDKQLGEEAWYGEIHTLYSEVVGQGQAAWPAASRQSAAAP